MPRFLFTQIVTLLVLLTGQVYAKGITTNFYKIEGGAGTSYLFGTFHYGIQVKDFAMDIPSRIKDVQTVMVEIKLTPQEIQAREENLFKTMEAKLLSAKDPAQPLDGQTLKAYMSLGIPEAAAKKVSDDDCMALFYVAPFLYPNQMPLDAEIEKLAYGFNKEIKNLDTPQLRKAALIFQYQRCSLKRTFEKTSAADFKEQFSNGLSEGLAEYSSGIFNEESLSSPIYTVRNHNWIDQIVPQIQRGPTLIAVGAGHLYGEEGLINLLRKQGFRVTKVVE